MSPFDEPRLTESRERCERLRNKLNAAMNASAEAPFDCGQLAYLILVQQAYIQAQQQVLADMQEVFAINCL